MSLDEARLLANLNRRATHLFTDGYRAKPVGDALVEIGSPSGETYTVDTQACTCSCPFYQKRQGKYGCKHLLGLEKLLADQEAVRLHNARMWEALA